MAHSAQTFPNRIARGWRAMAPDQRLAAVFAAGLFLTMFLPWYTKDTTAVIKGRLQTVSTTLIAWESFSFVEAAILLVAVGVLVLLFARAEGRAFHLPGGDGLVITVAGAWVALLVFYRLVDNKSGSSSSRRERRLRRDVGHLHHAARRRRALLRGLAHPSGPPARAAAARRGAHDRRAARRSANRGRPAPAPPPPPPDAPVEGQLTFDDPSAGPGDSPLVATRSCAR